MKLSLDDHAQAHPGFTGVRTPDQLIHRLPRRSFLAALAALGGGLALGAPRLLRADTCATTARQPIEGPYYLGDPRETNDTGDGLVVTGRVLDATTCEPIVGATIVRWHANREGVYEEYYRAKMPVGADGNFRMSTQPPGAYANLDPHIHWYLVADGYAPLTTQLQWARGTAIPTSTIFNFAMTKV